MLYSSDILYTTDYSILVHFSNIYINILYIYTYILYVIYIIIIDVVGEPSDSSERYSFSAIGSTSPKRMQLGLLSKIMRGGFVHNNNLVV